MHKTLSGRIIKATAGFYVVYCEHGEEYMCRARGVFRNEGITPLVGDLVNISPEEDGTGTVAEVLPRKNCINRPPLANLDQMLVVLSVVDPAPNYFVVDKFLALLEKRDIPPVIAITKSDLEDAGTLEAIYRGAGYPVVVANRVTAEGVAELGRLLEGKFTGLSGNSGVGKSSLLNVLDPDLALTVGATSKKLGRGRHTTRHVELFRLRGGLVADTPGFSSVTLSEMGGIDKEELADCFPEFRPFIGHCRFGDCAHISEKDCAVLAAVAAGKIHEGRHRSYTQLYHEVKDVKPWEGKN